jgi:HlyD family secretion protein
MRHPWAVAGGAAVAVFAAIFAILLLVRRDPGVQVDTSPVTSGTISRQVLATSSLEPSRSVEVGSEVSGTIQSVDVDFNSVVRAGQVVARIDPSTYQSELDGARAALAQARADASRMSTALADAETKFNRAKELEADQLIPRAELDAARVTMDQASADLHKSQGDIQAAQALIDQAEVSLSRTVIRSPIDGVVVNRSVNIGQTFTVRVQSPVLFTIADLRRMRLLVEVNEGEVGGIRPGSPVTFQIESLGDRTFEGRVADVRLLPYAEQAAVATTATGSTGTASTGTGSTGTASTSGRTSGSAGNPTGASGASGPAGRASSSAPAASASPAAASSTPTASPSPAATSSASSSMGPAAPGAVTYTAVVDVDNANGGLAPGGTAIVTLAGAQRDNALRIPNNALSFRPSPAVLERLGQKNPDLDPDETSGAVPADRRRRQAHVWRYENRRFVPVTVEIGISDEQWTEVVSGPLQAGDQLVTRADVAGGR